MAAPQPTYDLVLLLDPAAPEEQRAKALADVERIVGNDGTITSKHEWGTRALAFAIDHKREAEYRLLQFQAPAETLETLNRTLRIADGVTRFRIIKLRPGTPPPPDVRQDAPRPAEDVPEESPAAESAEVAEPAEPAPAA